MRDRTGFRILQRAIPLVRPFRTTAPVGTPGHLDPTNSGSCRENNDTSALSISRKNWRLKQMYRLYPIVEIEITVPLGMGNSVYNFPELPTTGFVRGRTSSSVGARTISTAMG